jgi:hypothetical protein
MLFILYNAKSAQRGKRKAIFEEFIKNYLYKAESDLKINLYLLDVGILLLLLFRLRINVGQIPVCVL